MTQYIIRLTGSLFGILHAIYLNFPGLFNEAKKTYGLSQKIQAIYFKIQGTYFKINALYFSPVLFL